MSAAYQVEYTFDVETSGKPAKVRVSRVSGSDDVLVVSWSAGKCLSGLYVRTANGFTWMTPNENEKRPAQAKCIEEYLDANPLPKVTP